MPYETNTARLLQLVRQALADKELGARLDQIAGERGFVLEDLIGEVCNQFINSTDESTVWRAASPYIDKIRATETQLNEAQQLMTRARSQPPLLVWLGRLLFFFGILAVILIVATVGVGFFIGWSTITSTFFSLSVVRSSAVTAGVLLAILISTYIPARIIRNRQLSKPISPEIFAEQINTIKSEADNAVIESGIKTVLREVVARYLPKSYKLTLEKLHHEGLAEVRNEKYDILTQAYEQLSQLVRNMRGGSIGLAGPRGSGKTTLMHSIVQIQALRRPVLSIMISAPVTYETRDFIILIFKLVCKRFLLLIGEDESTPWREMGQELHQSRLSGVLREISGLFGRWGPHFAVMIGGLMVTLALSMSVFSSGDRPISAITPATAPLATPSNQQSVSQTPSPATPSATPVEATRLLLVGVTNLFEEVGVTTKNGFRLGWILIFIGLAVIAIRRRMWNERSYLKEMRVRHSWHGNLADRARRWLKDLRFQQSYSSGWSGSLNLPVGLETGVENTIELAQHQLSLPEIVDGYRNLARDLTNNYTIIIGIDELDKIGSAEEAYRFLNGIKALFGIDDCFYLTSVSENALSSFERRGLPIRDAFDSSFDKIVSVEYLDYETSQRLLNRRVIGIPVPFLAFCYCMSGGLPRDLIRTCRLMFEVLAKDDHMNSLSDIVNGMILADVKLKLQAVAIAANQSQVFNEANKLLEDIYQVERLLTTSSLSFASCNLLLEYTIDTNSGQVTKSIRESQKKIALLITELKAYLYYLITLREYFTNVNIDMFKQDEMGEFDKLARARQLFAYSITESQRIITRFRQSHNIECLPAFDEGEVAFANSGGTFGVNTAVS